MSKHIEIEKNGKKIMIYGSNDDNNDKALSLLEKLDLTGNEMKDRLLIQEFIDNNKLKSSILYDGSTIYPFEKIVKAYRKLQKDDSLSNLTDELYHFFMNACGDIAHYNISGYIDNYGNSIRKLENEFLKTCYTTPRYTDVDRIFKELKIGKYFEERDEINLDSLTLKKLKNIITECGWEVLEKDNNLWELQINLDNKNRFCFETDIETRSAKNIIYSLVRYGINYNADDYAEEIIRSRTPNNNHSARSILNYADMIKRKLMTLSSDVLYKSRYEVEIMKPLKSYEIELER